MTKICVAFYTYCPDMNHPRHEYAKTCLRALKSKLTFDAGELYWHIADDGSPPEHLEALLEIAGEGTTYSNSNHGGYGANYNLSTQFTHQYDMILCLEEDWELMRKLDLSELASVLQAHEGIDCIRLGRIGWTGELRGKLVQIEGFTSLLFDPQSSEHHIFAGAPRLETVEFERNLGPWPEGLRAGTTEWEVCKRRESRVGVAWPMDAGLNASELHSNLFVHIGEIQA